MSTITIVSKCIQKVTSDTFAVIFLILMVFSTFAFEVICVLPHIYEQNSQAIYSHSAIGIFIIFNLLGNLFKIMKTDTSTRKMLLPSKLLPDWRFCASCESNSPPRSYHCNVCDACIAKRDHHCTFAASCIGYFNFRYYFTLLIYITIGALYASILNMFFIWDVLGGFTAYNFMAHTFPFIFWVLGLLPFKIMVWCMISVIDVCGFMFAVGMLVYHGSLLVSNQTVYEKNKAIHKYDLKHWKANVCESLGQRWFLVWISPWLKSELPRNGIDFPSYKEYKLKSHKNK